MMSNKNNEPEYIIDRLTGRRKKKMNPETKKRKPMNRSVDDSSTLGLGCWFFLVFTFIGTVLMLIILIGLLQ